MSKVPHFATLSNLKGIDLACQNLSARMVQNLTWLNYGFGLCERIIEVRENKDYTIPVVYLNDISEGMRAYPNDEWGTFCIWYFCFRFHSINIPSEWECVCSVWDWLMIDVSIQLISPASGNV